MSDNVYPVFIKASILAGPIPNGLFILEDEIGIVEHDVPINATTETDGPTFMSETANACRLLARIYERRGGVAEQHTVEEDQQRIREWGKPIFMQSTPMSTVKHMHKEVGELITATHLMDRENMGEEAADVLHLLFHYCNAAGLDLAAEFEKKFAINKARTWLPPNEEGIVLHDPKGE